MTTTRSRLTTILSATALALLLQQPAFSEDTPAVPVATPPSPPTSQPATKPAAQAQQPAPAAHSVPSPSAPAEEQSAAKPAAQAQKPESAEHPARAALARLEEQHAARMAELQKRYEELRAEAARYGFEMPSATPWSAGPQWFSYEEMQEFMKAHGIEMPAAPSSDTEIQPPPMPEPSMAVRMAEEQKRMLEIYEQMTPEEKEACSVLSRRYGARMQRRMHPLYSRPPMPQYPQGYGSGFGQPYLPEMMQPQQ